MLWCVGLYKCARRGGGLKRALAPPPPQPPHPLPPKGNEKVSGLTGDNPRPPPRGPKKKRKTMPMVRPRGKPRKSQSAVNIEKTFVVRPVGANKKAPHTPASKVGLDKKRRVLLPGAFFFSHLHQIALCSTLRHGGTGSGRHGGTGAGFFFAPTGSAGHVFCIYACNPKA